MHWPTTFSFSIKGNGTEQSRIYWNTNVYLYMHYYYFYYKMQSKKILLLLHVQSILELIITYFTPVFLSFLFFLLLGHYSSSRV